MKIEIGDLEKALVLAALYNAARSSGMSFLEYDPNPMTREEAELLLKQDTKFDAIKGRTIRVDLSCDAFDGWAYDNANYRRDLAENVIKSLRETGDINSPFIQQMHSVNIRHSAKRTKDVFDALHGKSNNVSSVINELLEKN